MPTEHPNEEPNITNEQPSIVIDNGSAYMRIGYHTENEPLAYETIIGKQSTIDDTKMNIFREELDKKKDKTIIEICTSSKLPSTGSRQDMIDRLVNKYISDNYITTIGKYEPNKMLYSIHPIELGEITNWSYMEKIWYHGFHNILNVNPSDAAVFLTDCVTATTCSRVKITKLMFEQFNIGSMYMGYNGVLSLYSCGKLSGIAADCGHGKIDIVPVNEGFSVNGTCYKSGFGGKQVSAYLKRLLLEHNPQYCEYTMNPPDFDAMKRENAYCCLDDANTERAKIPCEDGMVIGGYLRDIIGTNYTKYTSIDIENLCDKYGDRFDEFVRYKKKYFLPDGNMIEFNDEHFQCVEMMFDSEIFGECKYDGLHNMIIKGVGIDDNDYDDDRLKLLDSVVLCGGNSMFPGLSQRLKKELHGLLYNNDDGNDIWKRNQRKNVDINVIRHERADISNWIGGTIFSSLTSFKEMWIDKEEYKEFGGSIVHRRFF